MPELREALEEVGYEDVQTYLQSGNVLLSSTAKPASVARKCERQIAAKFDLDIAVVVRTGAELAKVVQRNPLGKIAKDPKRYQVSFLSAELGAEAVRKLEAAHRARVVGEGAAHHERSFRDERVDELRVLVPARLVADAAARPRRPCSPDDDYSLGHVSQLTAGLWIGSC